MKKLLNLAIILLSATSLPTAVMAGRGAIGQDPDPVVDNQTSIEEPEDTEDTDNKDAQGNPITPYAAAAGGVAVGAGLAGLTGAVLVNNEKVKAALREKARDDTTNAEHKDLYSSNPVKRAEANKNLEAANMEVSEKKALKDTVKAKTKTTSGERITGRPSDRGNTYRETIRS